MLPSSTSLGPITLLVKNLQLEADFYQQVLDFPLLTRSKNMVTFGEDQPLLILQEESDLPYPTPESAGLYHVAFLFSSSGRLARAILSILQKAPNLFQGAGDHLVSQAFYLTDPENNGIELYIDRPREAWSYQNGQLEMAALPINLEAFIAENQPVPDPGTLSVGHLHLKVGSIETAKHFYSEVLGFSVMVEHPTALFVSTGGYHHHLGMNTWESLGAGKRIPSLGLNIYEIQLPTVASLEDLQKRLSKHQIAFKETPHQLTLEDPWGNGIVVSSEN